MYAMVDGVLRMKGLKSSLVELGLASSDDVIEFQVDSAAGKSFVSRRGLGQMRHVELRDLWIQREVGEGKVRVVKVEGKANRADVGTKFLSAAELAEKLTVLNLELLLSVACTSSLADGCPSVRGGADCSDWKR